MAQDIGPYYDELHRWTERDKDFQVYSGFENDTIHRFLIDTDTDAFSPDTIYKYVDPLIAAHKPARGIDLGCGYGGTCFRCVKVHGGHWTGVTLSQAQWESAQKIAKARGLERAVEFHLISFDAPLPGRFNIAIGIESLIHSANPARTLANVAAALQPRGLIMIIDDMPVDPLPERDRVLLADFKRFWRCPVAPSAEGWIAAASGAALRLVTRQDFNHLLKPRGESDLDAAFADLSSQAQEKANLGFARLSEAELGGLHLERLLRRGSMRYVMLVFEKA